MFNLIKNMRLHNLNKIFNCKNCCTVGLGSVMCYLNRFVIRVMRVKCDCSVVYIVGTVSMAGMQSGLWSVHGGNRLVPFESVRHPSYASKM